MEYEKPFKKESKKVSINQKIAKIKEKKKRQNESEEDWDQELYEINQKLGRLE